MTHRPRKIADIPLARRGRHDPSPKGNNSHAAIGRDAENCAYLAEGASNEPTRQRYRRMEAVWRALAEEQDWLDGEPSPVCKSDG